MIENNSIKGVHRVRCSFPENGHTASFQNTGLLYKIRWWIKSQKICLCQLTSLVLYTFFWFLDLWSWDWQVVPKCWCGITTLCYAICQGSANLTWFGDAGLCVDPHELVQCGPVLRFICEFKTTSFIQVPNLRKKPILHSSKCSM